VGGAQAVKMYKERFQPSDDLKEPQANMAIFVFCSKDEEKIAQHKAIMDYRFIQFEKGMGILPLGYDDVKNAEYTLPEQDRIRYNRQRVVAGTPAMVKERLSNLAESYGVDEIIAVTIAEDFNDRLQSYKLLAELFNLQKPNNK
jgi:alkanesulfonate monooxygenase SsuD/methylene tetrahydromethanopterin reductase-like flavin-dependent oxidoreductase (luciferase family)